MWDGVGMKDTINENKQEYETFKTALYYHATRDTKALKVLDRMQEKNILSPNFGGFYTHYGLDRKPFPWVDANVETTMITILALERK